MGRLWVLRLHWPEQVFRVWGLLGVASGPGCSGDNITRWGFGFSWLSSPLLLSAMLRGSMLTIITNTNPFGIGRGEHRATTTRKRAHHVYTPVAVQIFAPGNEAKVSAFRLRLQGP